MRGATFSDSFARSGVMISIHAPLAGCDERDKLDAKYREISIHAPLAGCDDDFIVDFAVNDISIHAPLAGCDFGR